MLAQRLTLALACASLLAGCPDEPRPSATPILQPTPPPGTPTSRPTAQRADLHADLHPGENTVGAPPAGVEALPMLPSGHNSGPQLEAEAALLEDLQLRGAFRQAFVLLYTTEEGARNPALARALLAPLVEAEFAPALRLVGTSYVREGFDRFAEATAWYERAVAADEDYGMAHYNLAFMLAQTDTTRGARHLERALALGVVDERDLQTRYFGGGR